MRPNWENECVNKSALIEWLRPYLHTGEPITADVLISDIQIMPPTLTQPNEWVSAKDNPPQLTGKYICCIEDTHGHMWSIPADYLLEMKTWVGEFGEIKNKVVYWMPIPAPHDRRPPEKRKDTQ